MANVTWALAVNLLPFSVVLYGKHPIDRLAPDHIYQCSHSQTTWLWWLPNLCMVSFGETLPDWTGSDYCVAAEWSVTSPHSPSCNGAGQFCLYCLNSIKFNLSWVWLFTKYAGFSICHNYEKPVTKSLASDFFIYSDN